MKRITGLTGFLCVMLTICLTGLPVYAQEVEIPSTPATATEQSPAAVPSTAPDTTGAENIDLWSVQENLKTVIGIVTKGAPGYQQQTYLLIDQILHLLRSPKPESDGYYFAAVTRDARLEPIVLESTKVDALLDAGQFVKISGEVATPYELEIYSPHQRAAFKNNGDTFVKAYRVELIINGAKKTVERKFEDWVRRGTGHVIPLPGIAQWARLEIEAAVRPADYDRAIIKLRARVPQIADDPRNPYSFSIAQLKSAREYNRLESKRESVAEKLRAALDGLGYVPSPTAQPRPQINIGDLLQKLDYIRFLLDGTVEEQAEAKKKLKELIDDLKK